jgi:protein-tyrosine-phosphatase
VSPSVVLVVGTRNDSRSPAAERLLRAWLPDVDVCVVSAGTISLPGAPIDPPTARLLTAAGASAAGHVTRQLTAEMVRTADLILTTTRDERAAVVRLVPAAVRRTFTLREIARLAESLDPAALPDGDLAVRLTALVTAAPQERSSTVPSASTDDDVRDPLGGGGGAYEESFDQVRAAVQAIVETVRPSENASSPPGSPPLESSPPPGGRSPSGDPTPLFRRRSRARTAVLVVLVVLVLALAMGALMVLGSIDEGSGASPTRSPGSSAPPAPVAAPGGGRVATPDAASGGQKRNGMGMPPQQQTPCTFPPPAISSWAAW